MVGSEMAYDVRAVLKADFVLPAVPLLNTQEEVAAFKEAMDSDVEVRGTGFIAHASSSEAAPVRMLTLDRDRITLELSRLRSTVSRDYPARGELCQLAKAAWQAIDNTSSPVGTPPAFGFNVQLVIDQDSEKTALAYLSKRLFDTEALGRQAWQLVGGAGRVIFDESERYWTFSVEPRHNNQDESRLFLTANMERRQRPLPDEDGIRASLEEVWDEAFCFMKRLHAKGDHHG